MNIRNTLIKLLGGITKDEHEEFRSSCEQFALSYLESASGVTIGGKGAIENADFTKDCVVTGSETRISNSKFRGIAVAPWVEKCVFNAVLRGEARKQPEVFLRITCQIDGRSLDDILGENITISIQDIQRAQEAGE